MLSELLAESFQERYVRSFTRSETYIPFKPSTLCQLLIEELQKQQPFFSNNGDLRILYELTRRLTSAIKLATIDRFDEWQDSYMDLDPDVDVLAKSTADRTKSSLHRLYQSFLGGLAKALKDGNFEQLTRLDFEAAEKARSREGVQVAVDDDTEITTAMFTRGRRIQRVEQRTWKTLWLMKSNYDRQFYQRVLMVFNTEASVESARSASACSWILDYLPRSRASVCTSVKPGKLYLKIFKDIEVADIDMLIPGSRVVFTKWDYLLLFVPMFIGIIAAIVKAATGTLDFSHLTNAVTSVVLVILPLVYTVRAYWGFRQKEANYTAKLTHVLFLQTLAANSGAITSLLEEVADQETIDALLAYTFLWKGAQEPQPIRRESLHAEVKKFLETQMQTFKIETTIWFDVESICHKLQRLKLLKCHEYKDGGEWWVQAVPPEEALEALSSIDITMRKNSLDRGK